jgi:histone H3/H4
LAKIKSNMPRKRSVIAAAPMAEILKQAGAERVSETAAQALASVVKNFTFEVAKDAVKFAKHAGRKTVKREDIELARREY